MAKKKGKGWYGEKQRHSLAARGIKTTGLKSKKYKFKPRPNTIDINTYRGETVEFDGYDYWLVEDDGHRLHVGSSMQDMMEGINQVKDYPERSGYYVLDETKSQNFSKQKPKTKPWRLNKYLKRR
jgi:hypothetical protein